MYRAMGVHEHKNNVREHFYCLKEIFDLHKSKEQLASLLERKDVDITCSFEKYRMKDHALNQGGLSYKEFYPEHFRGVKIPDLP